MMLPKTLPTPGRNMPIRPAGKLRAKHRDTALPVSRFVTGEIRETMPKYSPISGTVNTTADSVTARACITLWVSRYRRRGLMGGCIRLHSGSASR